MSHILQCPKCQRTYPVKDEAELAGKNYCSDCEVELKPVQPSKPAVVSAMISAINIADAPAEVQAAFKAKPLQIANKYIIVKKLGQGGMGAVYQGWDISLRRYVALKVILLSADDPTMKEDSIKRFIREAQTAAKLAHPNILQVYEVGKFGDKYFICMEYVDGGTLDDYWRSRSGVPNEASGEKRHKTSKKPSKPEIAEYLQMMRRVAEGIDYAHAQNIIHRDIKPENVLLHIDKSGKTIPKVADFGLAKDVMSEKKLTMAGTVVGTPLYMSPEQAMAHKLDTRSDIFSLGSVIYKLCTGVEPFAGKSSLDVMKAVVNKEPIPPSRLNRAIDHDLDVLILKAMEKEKERRYQTAKELADDIDRYLKGETIRARPASVIYKITKIVKRNKLAFTGAAIGAVLLIILITVIAGIYQKGSAENLIARGYLEEADEYYSKKDYDKAKDAYTKYLTLVKDDEDAQDRLKQCEKKIAEAERLAKEALDEVQNAWVYAAQILPEFYKPKTDMDRVWEQIDKAIEMLSASLRKHPNPMGYFYRGMLFREKSEPEKAIKDFTSAIEQDKDLMMAYVLRGTVYFEQYTELLLIGSSNKDTEAKLVKLANSDFDKYSRMDNVPDKYPRLTEQFRKFIQLSEAVTYLKKDNRRCMSLLKEGYKEYRAEEFLYWLGVVNYWSGDSAAAVKYFHEALEIKPQYAQVFLMSGVEKGGRNDLDGEIADYDAVIRINPNYVIAYANRGAAKSKKGDLDGAFADCNAAIKLSPNYAVAYYNRGVVKHKQGDLDGAIADYTTTIKINPNYRDVYANRGVVKNTKGDFDGAIADCNAAIKLKPNDTYAYYNRGIAKYETGDLDGAIADYDTAIKLDTGNAGTYINRGAARGKKAEREPSPAVQRELLDGAMADYNAAIRLNPASAGAYINRGITKEKLGDLSGAVADWTAAIKYDPSLKPTWEPIINQVKKKIKK